MLKLCRVTKVKVLFLVLVYFFILVNFNLFVFSTAILNCFPPNAMSGQHRENYDVNRKQFTVTREMLTAVARDQRWPEVVACYIRAHITNHLMKMLVARSYFFISVFLPNFVIVFSPVPLFIFVFLNVCKGGGKRGHIVAETLLLMTFPCARKLGNICCGHKFCVRDTKMFLILFRNILCPQQMFSSLRAQGNVMSNNVSATMCPRLPPP